MPDCTYCNDTRRMSIGGDDSYTVMCTRCPRPCDACRQGAKVKGQGLGPFCEVVPCPCSCHQRDNTGKPKPEKEETERPDVALALGEMLHGETLLSKKATWAHILASYIRSLEWKAKRYDAMMTVGSKKSETRHRDVRIVTEEQDGLIVLGVPTFDLAWLEELAADATKRPVRLVIRPKADSYAPEVVEVVCAVRDPKGALGDGVRAGDIGLELATVGFQPGMESQWMAKVIRRWVMEEAVDDGCE